MLLWKCVAIRDNLFAEKYPEITGTTGHNTVFQHCSSFIWSPSPSPGLAALVLRAVRVSGKAQIRARCRGASFMRAASLTNIDSLLIQEVLMLTSLWFCLKEVMHATLTATHWALFLSKPQKAWLASEELDSPSFPLMVVAEKVFAKGLMRGKQPHSLWQRKLEQVAWVQMGSCMRRGRMEEDEGRILGAGGSRSQS